jgi:methylglutaconyl-CoA hydratase
MPRAPRAPGPRAPGPRAPGPRAPVSRAPLPRAPLSRGAVILSLDSRGVASLDLNRPEVGNAYNGTMIAGMIAAIDELSGNPRLRVVLLRGIGKHFQAGADLAWTKSVSEDSRKENFDVSRATAEAVDRLNRLAVPTLALVQGACFGGGTGFVAACDLVIAADNAVFSIAEVRWGLTCAIIIPELSAAVGVRQLRRYALSGERFTAAEAQRIGLVHQIVPLQNLAAAGEAMIGQLLGSAPLATAATKALLLAQASEGFAARRDVLVREHAARRQSAEAREGLAAFAARRAAKWLP